MALTLTPIRHPYIKGVDRYEATWKVAADSSYPTGGYSLTPGDLGFQSVSDSSAFLEVTNAKGYGTKYDFTTQKLLFYSAANTEVALHADLSGLTDIRLRATSRFRG